MWRCACFGGRSTSGNVPQQRSARKIGAKSVVLWFQNEVLLSLARGDDLKTSQRVNCFISYSSLCLPSHYSACSVVITTLTLLCLSQKHGAFTVSTRPEITRLSFCPNCCSYIFWICPILYFPHQQEKNDTRRMKQAQCPVFVFVQQFIKWKYCNSWWKMHMLECRFPALSVKWAGIE